MEMLPRKGLLMSICFSFFVARMVHVGLQLTSAEFMAQVAICTLRVLYYVGSALAAVPVCGLGAVGGPGGPVSRSPLSRASPTSGPVVIFGPRHSWHCVLSLSQ